MRSGVAISSSVACPGGSELGGLGSEIFFGVGISAKVVYWRGLPLAAVFACYRARVSMDSNRVRMRPTWEACQAPP